MQKILVLAANPKDTQSLRLDEELREIDEGLKRSKHRDQFELCQRHAVRARDVRRAMLDEMPQIVHFAGYGSAAEGLIFEDEVGRSQLASQDSLANLIELFADPDEFAHPITCVVLNGCYSPAQAEAIAQHIPFVIGLEQSIENGRRIEFAIGLYDALGAGRSVEFAFKFARTAYEMASEADERPEPVLIKGIPPAPRSEPLPQTGAEESGGTSAAVNVGQVSGSAQLTVNVGQVSGSAQPTPPALGNLRRWRKLGLAALTLLPVVLVGYWQGSRVLASRFYERGEVMYNAGDTAGAQTSFRRALQFNSALADAHFSLALIYEDSREFDRARKAYTQAKDAGSLGALNNLARLEIVEFEDYESAAAMLLSAVQSPQRDRTDKALEYGLRKNLGWAWFGQNRLTEAEGELIAASNLEEQIEGSRPDSYCLLAQVYENQENPEAALPQWQTCRRKITRPEDDVWKGLANQALSEEDSASKVTVN